MDPAAQEAHQPHKPLLDIIQGSDEIHEPNFSSKIHSGNAVAGHVDVYIVP